MDRARADKNDHASALAQRFQRLSIVAERIAGVASVAKSAVRDENDCARYLFWKLRIAGKFSQPADFAGMDPLLSAK